MNSADGHVDVGAVLTLSPIIASLISVNEQSEPNLPIDANLVHVWGAKLSFSELAGETPIYEMSVDKIAVCK